MPLIFEVIDYPECDIRPARQIHIATWVGPRVEGERFPPLAPEREAEIRREAAERLRAIRPMKVRSPAPGLPFRPKHQASGSCTYMIGAEGSNLVKIGWAKEPKNRVSYLQIGSPLLLALLWSDEGPYEGPLHQRFKDYRVRGEWFDLTSLGDPVEVVTAAVEEIKAAE